MVGHTSDVAASAQVSSAQAKPARPQTKDQTPSSSFGDLVDSNTQAINNAISNSAPSSNQDNAPRRSDASSNSSSSGSSDRSSNSASTDQSSQSKASDGTNSQTTTPASDTPAAPAKAGGKSKDKADASTTKAGDAKDASKDVKTDSTDGLAAAVDASVAAQTATPAATPDPTAVPVAAPVVPVDPNAAANQVTSAASSPLTIAAAGIAASASITAQISGTKTHAAGKAAKTGDGKSTDAKAALTEVAVANSDTTATDVTAKAAQVTAVDQGTPKSSFKAVVTTQGQTDVSNIGQDPAKTAQTATPAQNPATPTAAAAAHQQGPKPQTDAATTDAKVDAANRTTDVTPAAPVAHAHADTPAVAAATTDVSTQAANAVQAPQTTTTSTATASTATLTATAANPNAMPISGIPVEIAAAARAGKTRFDISLDPVDLGRIDVRINVDRNGQVTSHLTVEKPETLQMLRQDAPQLQRALDDAGLKTGSNGLSFSLRDQNSSGQNAGQNNDNGNNSRRLIISEDDQAASLPVRSSYGRMLGSSSGVDIRV
ncbi:flagellar hook-length control protein FliK [Bradyrhizobium manausense]|uniref:Flagellar hook-length control protein n=1 Tax=Bradyrhizobium manausense TaxID=989370 RepID=A0A0R3CX34_9BRAD|nr:flagellar hook-length control protein FliK [Bradyrhizobium manausense]KRQ02099.1 flagellar hook-length control protein [Bradyrhizobium manausense]